MVTRAVGEAVVVEVEVDASPETVFEFLVDPEKLVRWKGISADLEPEPGGVYRCQVTPGALAVGRFVEVDPPRRVVFTFGWEGDGVVAPGSTTVEITLARRAGKTLVTLAHNGLPEDRRDLHREGWEHYAARLQVAAAGGDPGVDPWTQSSEEEG